MRLLLCLYTVLLFGGCADSDVYARKERILRQRCMENLVAVGLEARAYAHANDGRFPETFMAFARQIKDVDVFVCPSSKDRAGDVLNVTNWTSYVWIGGRTLRDEPSTPLAHCRCENHRGSGAPVLRVDGSVAWEFKERMQALGLTD